MLKQRGLPLIMNAPRGRGGGGFKPPIHLYCILHAKRGEGVQIACQIAYIINGRPQRSKAFNYNNDICIIKM